MVVSIQSNKMYNLFSRPCVADPEKSLRIWIGLFYFDKDLDTVRMYIRLVTQSRQMYYTSIKLPC
jgi:hypothetical protein